MYAAVLVILVALLGVAVVCATGIGRPGAGPARETLRKLAERLGLGEWPIWLTGLLVAIWAAPFVLFLAGLIYVPVFLTQQDFGEGAETASELRWTLLALAAVTAALSAVVALPFTLLRTKYNREQTDYHRQRTVTEEEGLLTDRINKAVEGLGAEKEVNRLGRNVTFKLDDERHSEFQWKGDPDPVPEDAADRQYGEWRNVALTNPNLEVRVGAIYALERIALRNIDEVHVQIMEILCAYIRENAPAKDDEGPEDWLRESEDDGPLEEGWRERMRKYDADLVEWLRDVAPRTDVQVALEVIGRRTEKQRAAEARHGGAWTQGFVFDHPPESTDADEQPEGGAVEMRAAVEKWKRDVSAYSGYRLDLQATDLRGARLDGLNFAGAVLGEAWLQGAWLDGARLQGASLQGAVLAGIEVDSKTNLTAASSSASAVSLTDYTGCIVDRRFFEAAFGDGSVKGLPKDRVAGEPPLAHWACEALDDEAFEEAWRAWQVEIGHRKPDDPA